MTVICDVNGNVETANVLLLNHTVAMKLTVTLMHHIDVWDISQQFPCSLAWAATQKWNIVNKKFKEPLYSFDILA